MSLPTNAVTEHIPSPTNGAIATCRNFRMNQTSRVSPSRPARVHCVWLLALAIGVLGGCGWQLRGQGDAPQHIDSLHIGGRPLDAQLRRELERDLDALGIPRKESAHQAQYSLVILDQKSKRRTAALSARARTSELELIEEVEFTLLASDGSEVIPPATVRDDRVFEYNEDDILATDDEAQLLRREMRANLVRQIIAYLQRVGPRPAANAPAP